MRKWIGAALATLLLATAIPSLSQQGGGTRFSDIPAGHWATEAVNQLADAGIFEGMGVNRALFVGNGNLTRYQAAVALSRLIQYVNTHPATPTAQQLRQVIEANPDLRDMLTGKQGPVGPPGPAGQQGPAGRDGAAGTPGAHARKESKVQPVLRVTKAIPALPRLN